ncbi:MULTISPECIES: hypothetical protein, partial [unclassified Pseudomonas]|uniref:hypothetical protein n=1 Tax=unclassified Pseudomonas TaxID=196821 RepID=UPI001C483A93
SKFLFQLQPLALSISRQREANSTALHAAVNTSFSAFDREDRNAERAKHHHPLRLPPGFAELKRPAAENFATR